MLLKSGVMWCDVVWCEFVFVNNSPTHQIKYYCFQRGRNLDAYRRKRSEECKKRGITRQPQVLLLGDTPLAAQSSTCYMMTSSMRWIPSSRRWTYGLKSFSFSISNTLSRQWMSGPWPRGGFSKSQPTMMSWLLGSKNFGGKSRLTRKNFITG